MGAHGRGCISCKARRVKCDETHPNCQRCQKTGIRCKGYDQFKWIDEKPRVEQAMGTLSAQEERHSALQKSSSSMMYHKSELKKVKRYIPPQSVPTEMSFLGFKDSMLVSFLTSKLSEGRAPVSGNGFTSEGTSWIEEISIKSTSNALNALAAMIFGLVHFSLPMVEEGRRSYGKAISNLRLNLLNSSHIKSFETLASVTALCMYEITDRRSEAAWNYHADALSRLVEIRHPSQFQNHPEKSVFAEQRAIIALKAIFSGHSTFLSQPAWKTVPWENDPSTKEPTDYFVDILCDITVYHEELNTPGGMTLTRVLDIKNRVFASLRDLNFWWKAWLQNSPDPCQEYPVEPENSFSKDATGTVFETLLQFSRLAAAYTLCTYNATRILLLRILLRISQAEEQTVYHMGYYSAAELNLLEEPNDKKTPLLGVSSNIEGLAHEIFRAIEYVHHQTQDFMTSFANFYLLDIAYSALDPRSREAKWFRSKLSLPMRSGDEKLPNMTTPPSSRFSQTILPSCRFAQNLLTVQSHQPPNH